MTAEEEEEEEGCWCWWGWWWNAEAEAEEEEEEALEAEMEEDGMKPEVEPRDGGEVGDAVWEMRNLPPLEDRRWGWWDPEAEGDAK